MSTRKSLLAALATMATAASVAVAGSVVTDDPCDMRYRIEQAVKDLPAACPDPRGEVEHY